jgi:hypothetical protein
MRRDYFDVTLRETSTTSDMPELVITYDGPTDTLSTQLDTALTTDEIDIAFRHHTDDTGVLALTDRVTGEFVLEAVAPIETIETVVSSARQDSDTGEYELRLTSDETDYITCQNQTLLIYSADGDLLQDQSLISESIEL